MFRAFDDIAPSDVKVVVIGQDPYPHVTRATGRAFEDGSLVRWGSTRSWTIRRLLQWIVAWRLGRPDLAKRTGWKLCRALLEDGTAQITSLRDYFDNLQRREHVLLLNAALTGTRFKRGLTPEQEAHIGLWRPVMKHLIERLAVDSQGRIVFLLVGDVAKDLFRRSGVCETRRVPYAHPSHNPDTPDNPLAQINSKLEELGVSGVNW